jgi:hypothetical protein
MLRVLLFRPKRDDAALLDGEPVMSLGSSRSGKSLVRSPSRISAGRSAWRLESRAQPSGEASVTIPDPAAFIRTSG